jgi:hypothetical protein
MKNWKIRLEFKIEDLWVGLFWKSKYQAAGGGKWERSEYDLWICLIPCVPIHLRWVSPRAYAW